VFEFQTKGIGGGRAQIQRVWLNVGRCAHEGLAWSADRWGMLRL
jgi:hypothetical protein